jgi:hypothetical protein
MAIYLGGVLAGIAAGYLAIKTTFAGTPEERAAAVRFWGFRAPLGAWVMVWGAIAMLTSAPFDDWWHNAYGLDVKIVSPPHSLLAGCGPASSQPGSRQIRAPSAGIWSAVRGSRQTSNASFSAGHRSLRVRNASGCGACAYLPTHSALQ